MVPLGAHSEWARNVVAAGHCRLQWHDTVYDLDEPAMLPAAEAGELPPTVRGAMAALGFEYLQLRTFSANTGTLGQLTVEEPSEDVQLIPA